MESEKNGATWADRGPASGRREQGTDGAARPPAGAGGWGLDRRRFLRMGGALSLGLVGGWGCRWDSGGAPTGDGEAADSGSPSGGQGGMGAGTESTSGGVDAMPPLVVGLRSLGGAFRFDPVGLQVEVGSEVRWLNMGDFHTVSAFHPDNASLISGPVPLRIPESASSFHSGMLGLSAGSRFTHRFDVEGVHDYFCQPHYSFGMVGRIIVGEPVDGPALNRPEDDLIEAARAQMPAVDAILGPSGRGYRWSARLNGVLYRMANDGAPVPAAEAVASGALADDVLGTWLGSERLRALEEALEALVTEAGGSGDYEAVLRRADEAKEVLREAMATV